MIFNISNQKFNIKKSDLDNKVSKNDLFNEEGQLTTDAIALGEGVTLYNGDPGYLQVDCETLDFSADTIIELATPGDIDIVGGNTIALKNKNYNFYLSEGGLTLSKSDIMDLYTFGDSENSIYYLGSNANLNITSDFILDINGGEKISLTTDTTMVNILPNEFKVETNKITLLADSTGIDITGPNGTLKFSDDETDFTYKGNKIYHEGNKPTAVDVGAVPTSRTINGKVLTDNITLSGADIKSIASKSISFPANQSSIDLADAIYGKYDATNYDVIVAYDGTSYSDDSYQAWQDAKIIGTVANFLVVKGITPTVPIPLVIKAVKK